MVPGGEDTGESEVELHLPHEAGLRPDRILNDIPAAMGTAGEDTGTCDPGQMRRLEAVDGPNRNGPSSTCRPGRHRDRMGCHQTPGRGRGSRGPTGFHSICRPRRIRAWIDNHWVPGRSRYPTTRSTGRPQLIWGRTDNHRVPGRNR